MGCVGEDGGGGYDDDGLIVMVQPARHSVRVHASRQPYTMVPLIENAQLAPGLSRMSQALLLCLCLQVCDPNCDPPILSCCGCVYCCDDDGNDVAVMMKAMVMSIPFLSLLPPPFFPPPLLLPSPQPLPLCWCCASQGVGYTDVAVPEDA